MAQLAASVRYPVTMRGWHSGTLVYVDDVITLSAEDGSLIFQTSISEITKVRRNALTLTFYTVTQRQTISFGDMYTYMANTSGGRGINPNNLNEAEEQMKSADSQMSTWVHELSQHKIQIKGGNGTGLLHFEKKARFVQLAIIIIVGLMLGWIFLIKPLFIR